MINQSLKGFDTIFDQTLNNELQDNIVEFLDWGLLEKGNYFNVTLGELSPNGSDYSLLSSVEHSHYDDGQIWEGFRKNWVWQSGIDISGRENPIVGTNDSIPGISGIYVNDTFYPSDTAGTYAHKVDYFNGRVVFDNPIPTGSKVQAEYSYKYINVVYSNALPWLREIEYRTSEPSSRNDLALTSEMKVQLPAIAVEIVPRRTLRGYQLGGGQYIYTDVLFHCVAEDEITRNKLIDIISLQNDKTIYMFDSNRIAGDSAFPLNYQGVPVPSAKRYPDLLSSYAGDKLRLQDTVVQGMELINSNFYAGIVKMTTEVIKASI